MKKVALSFVAFALFVGGAFAQAAAPAASVGIGAWGRGIYAPLASNNSGSPSGVTAGIGTSWGNSPRIGFTIHGDSQYVGFLAHIGVDNNQFSITDDTQIWIKPFDGLEFQIGRAFNDTLRGEGSFGSWNWIRTVGMYQGDDAVFKRIGGLAGGAPGPQNAIVSYSNSGLFLFWEQAEQGAGPTSLTTYSDASANGGLANASYGAGYTIANVGQLRVQNIGFADNGSTSVGQLQAAFRLTGVQNLYADIGIWIPTNVAGVNTAGTTTAADIAGYDFQIPFYANYKVDKATVHLGFNYKSYNSHSSSGANGAYDVAVGADYDMGSGVGLTGDFQIGNKYWATNSNGDAPMSFMLAASKGFSNGSIGIGFQYSKLGFVATTYPGNYSADNNAEWAVPIKVEYWF